MYKILIFFIFRIKEYQMCIHGSRSRTNRLFNRSRSQKKRSTLDRLIDLVEVFVKRSTLDRLLVKRSTLDRLSRESRLLFWQKSKSKSMFILRSTPMYTNMYKYWSYYNPINLSLLKNIIKKYLGSFLNHQKNFNNFILSDEKI